MSDEKGALFCGEVSQMQHVYGAPVRVRYADTDAMGVVYHGTYITYFEVGRNETMRVLDFPYSQLEREGFLMPVIDVEVHYIAPAHYDELLTVYTGILETGPASIVFGYRVEREEEHTLLTWGSTRLGFVDKTTRKVVRMPSELKERLER